MQLAVTIGDFIV